MRKNRFASLFGMGLLLVLGGNAHAADSAWSFPDVATASNPNGSFVNADNLANVQRGLTKDQVRELIGTPHFNEGIFRVREWNYVLNFRDGEGIRKCQYQVRFDEHAIVEKTFWKDPGCAPKRS